MTFAAKGEKCLYSKLGNVYTINKQQQKTKINDANNKSEEVQKIIKYFKILLVIIYYNNCTCDQV